MTPRTGADRPASRVTAWLPLAGLLVAGLLYFARPLFFDETFYYRDLCQFYLPQARLLAATVGDGELPLWNPLLSGGRPLLASPASRVFYPSNLLYLFLTDITAFNVEIVLHLLLCGVATYALARTLSLSRAGSLLAATGFAFCGYTLSLSNVLNRLLALPHLPLLLTCWLLYLRAGRRRWFLAAVAVGWAQLMTGDLETSLISWITLAGFTLLGRPTGDAGAALGQRCGQLVLLGVLVGGLTSIQLLPTAELVARTTRGAGLSYTERSSWSLHPRQIPEVIVPGYLGRVDTLAPDDYWGQPLFEAQFPYVVSIYWGFAALWLAGTAVVRGRQSNPLPDNTRRLLAALIVVPGTLALGRFLPGFELLAALPGAGSVRFPIKFLIASLLPVALLAGFGLDDGFAADRRPGRLATVLAAIAAAVLLALAAGFMMSDAFATGLLDLFLGRSPPLARARLVPAFWHLAAVAGASALIFLHRRAVLARWHAWGLVVIVGVDLLAAGGGAVPTTSRPFIDAQSPLGSYVASLLAPGERLFRTPNPPSPRLRAPYNDIAYQYRWNLDVLADYYAARYGIAVIHHGDYDGLATTEMQRLTDLIFSLPWQRRLPALSASAVALVITHDEVEVPGLRLLTTVPNSSNLVFRVYRNERVMATPQLVTRWVGAATDRAAIAALADPTFDPRTSVILEASAKPAPSAIDCRPGAVTVVERGPLRSTYAVASPCDAVLVFSEPNYPGFTVTVDGIERPSLRANLAFSAVRIEAGDHRVQRRFVATSVVVGATVSAAFMTLLVALLWSGRLLLTGGPTVRPRL